MKNEKTIEVLNKLIIINNDRIEGYETAAKETEENELKSLFARFIGTSERCKQELIREVNLLGGVVAEGTKVTGKFFRVWMDVRAAITGKDRLNILGSCEYGEDAARETYEEALKNNLEYLNVAHQSLITTQKQLLQADRNHVKMLSDALSGA
jgi:uncharacterized protein (TIGR02284 family)